MNSSYKKYLLTIIKKYQNGIATDTEIEQLSNFYTSHQENKDWPQEAGLKEVVKSKILQEIKSGVKVRRSKKEEVRILRFRVVLKYAAAIALLIASGYYLSQDLTEKESSPVVNHTVKIGTDKAILTLETGEEIVLEKGTSIQTHNASSNGEKIIYKEGSGKNNEVVYNYLTIPRGGQFFIKLSDGTEVWLNSDSQLKYPVNFVKGKDRQVELVYGEAYFDVSESVNHGGSKFEVLNPYQKIEVLGTEFNIKAYREENTIYTTLVEGKVIFDNFSSKGNLKPGEQSIITKNTNEVKVKKVDIYSEISWKDGVFSFKEKPLKEIMKVLSRWYDVDIVFESNKNENMTFNGVFKKDQNIEDILIIIQDTNEASYEKKGNKIIIKTLK